MLGLTFGVDGHSSKSKSTKSTSSIGRPGSASRGSSVGKSTGKKRVRNFKSVTATKVSTNPPQSKTPSAVTQLQKLELKLSRLQQQKEEQTHSPRTVSQSQHKVHRRKVTTAEMKVMRETMSRAHAGQAPINKLTLARGSAMVRRPGDMMRHSGMRPAKYDVEK